MSLPEKATCRYCKKELVGKSYHTGNMYAYDPKTREPAKINYYGGFVCSLQCDFNASLELERSMPGHGSGQKTLGCGSGPHHINNWK